MDFHSPDLIKKTLFWQRIALVTLCIFLAVVTSVSLFYFNLWFRTNSYRWDIELFLFGYLFAILAAGGGIAYTLFQSIQMLQFYLQNQEIKALEIAIRKQRQFWMGLTLLVLSAALGIFLLLFVSVGASSPVEATEF